VRDLAIPPAWDDVWICPTPNGHLQATGQDAAGRTQYLYHPRWRTHRDREKFDRMLAFARRLPAMRKATGAALAAEGLGRERVLACAVRLLDRGFFRVGGEAYADEHDSFGLATLRRRHVRVEHDGMLVFEYPGKGGKRVVQRVVDPAVNDVVVALLRRRTGGEEFLAFRERRRWADVRSSDVNAAVKDLLGNQFSAKDFRTWHATVLAAVGLAVSTRVASKPGRKRAVARAVSEVAFYLGNTPAVCRASYIDPRVIDRFHSGVTIAPTLERLRWTEAEDAPATQGPIERAVIRVLSG
jgi:DNA topoisomerase I